VIDGLRQRTVASTATPPSIRKAPAGWARTRHAVVVNPKGETHDVRSLYIADASLLPTSIGYNPSETVYALASYISDQINAAHA